MNKIRTKALLVFLYLLVPIISYADQVPVFGAGSSGSNGEFGVYADGYAVFGTNEVIYTDSTTFTQVLSINVQSGYYPLDLIYSYSWIPSDGGYYNIESSVESTGSFTGNIPYENILSDQNWDFLTGEIVEQGSIEDKGDSFIAGSYSPTNNYSLTQMFILPSGSYDINITTITDVYPVDEPETFGLLITGIILLGFFKLKV